MLTYILSVCMSPIQAFAINLSVLAVNVTLKYGLAIISDTTCSGQVLNDSFSLTSEELLRIGG